MIAFKGKKFLVNVEKVKLPSGESIRFETVMKQAGTVVIPLVDKTTILMNLQYRVPVKTWIYEFPGGKIEKNETARQNALKELEEELGYKAGKMKFIAKIHPAPYITNDVQHIFLATDLRKTKRSLEKGEIIKMKRIKIKNAMKMLKAGKITDAATIIALLMLTKGI